MKILVVDRDDVAREFIHSKLDVLGYSVQISGSKNEALELSLIHI